MKRIMETQVKMLLQKTFSVAQQSILDVNATDVNFSTGCALNIFHDTTEDFWKLKLNRGMQKK